MSYGTVYLAGPIGGCTYEGCTEWRKHVGFKLRDMGLRPVSPMRSKRFLSGERCIDDRHYTHPLATPRGILARDFWDCNRCDVVLAVLTGVTKVSIGTVMEIAWAYQAKIPVVLVIEDEGNPHEHVLLAGACPFRVSTIDDAMEIVSSLLVEDL